MSPSSEKQRTFEQDVVARRKKAAVDAAEVKHKREFNRMVFANEVTTFRVRRKMEEIQRIRETVTRWRRPLSSK